jgi:ribosomal protein S18 acetylase RimI-like enzyme
MSPALEPVRRGRLADVDALVDLHYRIFDEHTHLAMLLGRGFVRAAYHWYTETADAFTLIAEIDGRLEGSCTVNRGSYYIVFRHNMRALVSGIMERPSLLLNRALWKRALALRPTRLSRGRARRELNNQAYLAYLAVSPAARGAGIGKQLIEAAIFESRRRGWEDVVTAIHRANLPARFMYKTLGFEEFPELNHDDLIGIRLRSRSLPAVVCPPGSSGMPLQ